MGNQGVFRYRPNGVLDYISNLGRATSDDLEKIYPSLDTATIVWDLLRGGLIEQSGCIDQDGRFYNEPPVSFQSIQYVFIITPLGRERMKEDLGVIEYVVSDHEFSPRALEFLSRGAKRRLRDPIETVSETIGRTKEAFTKEETKELKKEFPNI